MGVFPSIAVFFVLWWLCLFVVLPFGVKSQHETDETTPGTEAGAPVRPRLLAKAIATTVLAALIFGAFHLYFNVLGLSLEDLVR